MPCITVGQFNAPVVRRMESVPLPECGEGAFVNVREMTCGEVKSMREDHGASGDTSNLSFLFRLISLAVCDESGALLFKDTEHAQENFNLSIPVLERIAKAALKLAGLDFTEKN